jgi:hypothetical protein
MINNIESLFIDLPIVQKNEGIEYYSINVLNINYIRKWVGIKGELQSVIYFNGSDKKYLIVNLPKASIEQKINSRVSVIA